MISKCCMMGLPARGDAQREGDMKDMSNEELINKFRAMCNLFIIYGKFQKEQDFNEANKISDELLSRLSTGDEAVKKVAEQRKEKV